MKQPLVLLLSSLSLLAACDLSSTLDPRDPDKANQLTRESISSMLDGDEDFAALQAKLGEALQADPTHLDARLALASVVFMSEIAGDIRPGGDLNRLLTQSGVTIDLSQGLYGIELGLEQHNQGLIKDTTPDLNQWEGYLRERIKPAVEVLVVAFESVPSNWEYTIPAADGGWLLQLVSPGGSHPLRLDYGDAQAIAAVGRIGLAVMEMLSALDYDALLPNDLDIVENPDLDVWGILQDRYTNFGILLRPDAMGRARDQIGFAFNAYQRALDHLKGESGPQSEEGLLTLGRDTFEDQAAKDAFLALETQVRAWVGEIVAAFTVDAFTAITNDPTGGTLPTHEQVSLNFARFWQGIEMRSLYLKTVIDPLSNPPVTELGVSSFADLTQTMATFSGVIGTIGDNTPGPGDLQEILGLLGYAVRIDAPPTDTKTIDGNFGDWATDRVQIGASPQAQWGEARPDLGDIWAARDASNLFVYVDADLAECVTGSFDEYEVRVTWSDGDAEVTYRNGTHTARGDKASLTPVFRHTSGQGIEIRFPVDQGDWAAVQVEIDVDNVTWEFDSERDKMFVKVR